MGKGARPLRTPSVFTIFASSRFIDRQAVREALRQCAQRLKATQPHVRAVYLFGSFATNRATPHSDADIVVAITPETAESQQEIYEAARTTFLEAPVPVDLFVLLETHMAKDWGVARAVKREGVQLA
jgi:predicted nucleotidyltransferase